MTIKKRYFYTLLTAGLLSAVPFPSAAASNVLCATKVAYVINGHGITACPVNSLCLYANEGYNSGPRDSKILVIPSGVSAGNFSDYGFDAGYDGVSSVVNNTNHETGLLSSERLGRQILRIPAGMNIPTLFNIPLGSSTWNDKPRSAVSARIIAADLSVNVHGPVKALSGADVAYEIEVANDGPDAVPNAIVNIDIPSALDAVSLICTSTTASCGRAAADGTSQDLNIKNNGRATLLIKGTVQPDFSGAFIIGADVESAGVINTSSRNASTLRTAVTKPPIVADLSLSMQGSAKATPGAHVAYTMEVDNHGPDAVQNAVLDIAIPSALESHTVTCSSTTASCGETAVDGSFQALSMKKNGHAKVTLAATVSPKFTGSLSVGANLKSPGVVNTAPVYSGSVATVVKKNVVKNLEVSDVLSGSWSDWKSGGQIYSYRLTVTAAHDDVRRWTISFDGLPKGIEIYNKDVLWTDIIEDGQNGKIVLATPKDGVHVVAAGKPLNIDLQLLYPAKDDAYNRLESLTATQLQ